MVKERFKLFTSESVGKSHVDGVADAISNYLQDKYMEGDKNSKIAVETAIFGKNVFVGGEVTSNTTVDVIQGVKDVFKDVGYSHEGYNIENHIIEQSAEINGGVVKDNGEVGAGDQGLVFGYASGTNQTDYMPTGAHIAHEIAKRQEYVRKEGILPYLGPDAKAQVTAKLDECGNFVGLDSVVLSSMHEKGITLDKLREDISKHIIDYVLDENNVDKTEVKYLINTAGLWSDAFFSMGDAGLTGRKIICNSYLGYGRHGGGNFNGKDNSKVDRSGAYMSRYLAKNILNDAKVRYKDLCPQEVEIQMGFAIGVVEPVSINVEVRSNGEVLRDISYKYQDFIEDNISCSVKGIIDRLDLLNQKMYPTSAYGHFGGHRDFTWERLDIDFEGLDK